MSNWDLMFQIVCVHRDINMSLNKTDSCILITQLMLVNLLYFRKWYVCNINFYSVLRHNAKQTCCS